MAINNIYLNNRDVRIITEALFEKADTYEIEGLEGEAESYRKTAQKLLDREALEAEQKLKRKKK